MGAINAVGKSIPPLLIFPRVKFRNHMLNGAPPGTTGAANPSGWINAELIMDNHTSHISVAVIDKAKGNEVILLTFPLHTSHKLQPLDRTVGNHSLAHLNQKTFYPVFVLQASRHMTEMYFLITNS